MKKDTRRISNLSFNFLRDFVGHEDTLISKVCDFIRENGYMRGDGFGIMVKESLENPNEFNVIATKDKDGKDCIKVDAWINTPHGLVHLHENEITATAAITMLLNNHENKSGRRRTIGEQLWRACELYASGHTDKLTGQER